MTEEGLNKLKALAPELTARLDECYRIASMFPVTKTHDYQSTLTFTKGLGFKVYRNSQGTHKLVFDESTVENLRHKEDK